MEDSNFEQLEGVGFKTDGPELEIAQAIGALFSENDLTIEQGLTILANVAGSSLRERKDHEIQHAMLLMANIVFACVKMYRAMEECEGTPN